METYLDCIPCFMRQALDTGRVATSSKKTQKKILESVSEYLSSISLSQTPPQLGEAVHRIIREVSGNEDPYKELKKRYNRIAKELYPQAKEIVEKSDAPLLDAVQVAIVGNVIDFGAPGNFDIQEDLGNISSEQLGIFHYDKLVECIEKSQKILYLADNAGEIYFDRILIEVLDKLDKNITVAVKESPVINDALLEDALYCDIDDIARVISNGSAAPGTLLESCSQKFKEAFENADLIISKGQGNFESLSDIPREIAFMLKVKCEIVAEDLDCEEGDIVLKMNSK